MKVGIHWFRRDLRIQDNRALAEISSQVDRLVLVFILDSRLTSPQSRPLPRAAFLLDCVSSLKEDLEARGQTLWVRAGQPESVIPELIQELGASVLSFNQGVTPFAKGRDTRVRSLVSKAGADLIECIDESVIPPMDLKTLKDSSFQVFAPFQKAWWREWNKAPVTPIPDFIIPPSVPGQSSESVEIPALHEVSRAMESFPSGGAKAAHERLDEFLDGPVGRYALDRDRPDRDGTSGMSAYLRFGSISSRVCMDKALQARARAPEMAEGVDKWISELIWRDFYVHITWSDPGILNRNVRREFDRMEWNEDPEAFSAWANGMTGYPLVDAGMRQLRETGWMHNRVRMVVASFLTKDLLIDWRKGERLFMDLLIDGDPASNNGGWQWTASTGNEAQPFIRIFNPVAQGRTHDPDCKYIKRWVPELRDVPARDIHSLWKNNARPEAYPAPMVDHVVQRDLAIEAYERMRKADKFDLRGVRRRAEEGVIRAAIQETAGNRSAAARLLGISHRSLMYKLKEMDV